MKRNQEQEGRMEGDSDQPTHRMRFNDNDVGTKKRVPERSG